MFNTSWTHQYAGLNRVGIYMQPAREKGTARSSEGENGRRGDRPNEIWRRITGIFPRVEMSAKERRRGLRLLMRRIEERVARGAPNCNAGFQPAPIGAFDCSLGECGDIVETANEQGVMEKCATGLLPYSRSVHCASPGENKDGPELDGERTGLLNSRRPVAHSVCEQGDAAPPLTPRSAAVPQPGSSRRPSPSRGEGIGGAAPSPQISPLPEKLSLAEDWEFSPESWVCVERGGISVQRICFELGMTEHTLTLLIKEYCGLSAAEFLDGLKIRGLKKALGERLRAAAEILWGEPGALVWRKLDGVGRFSKSPGERCGDERVGNSQETGRFENSPYFNESRSEERARRIDELCAILSPTHGSAKQQQTRGTRELLDLECFAVNAGFASLARLKRACLIVLGKSLRAIERELAWEVVQFYLCAEDRQLREIACTDGGSVTIARARILYHDEDDKPTEPFLDEWSKFEELKPHWLSRMREMFGA